MIHIRLMGGLGNQLYQYALGRELIHRGKQVQFDRQTLCDYDGLPHHRNHTQYGLDGYAIEVPLGSPQGLEINDWDMRFRPEVLGLPDADYFLHGHWQCEKYFPSIKDELKRDLVPTMPLHHFIAGKTLKCRNSVCLQVRRGDYLSIHENSHWHGVIGTDYYLEALKLIPDDPEIYTISDDPEWCDENLPGKSFTTGDRHRDLWLISQCKHVIMGNSTFGWWGAWLGEQPDSVIVAPKKWFAHPDLHSDDIIPDRWLRV